MESGWNVRVWRVGGMYGCGEQEVGVASGSGWNLWVWLLGVVLRGIYTYRFLHTTYPYSSCISVLLVAPSFKILEIC